MAEQAAGAPKETKKTNEKNMLFRHNAKADAFGVDRWLASLQHDMCYDYPCFVILERREGTNICICRGRSCACPLLALVLRGYKRELRALRATKGPKSGRVLVLFALLGGHAGTAPTVSVLCYLFSAYNCYCKLFSRFCGKLLVYNSKKEYFCNLFD